MRTAKKPLVKAKNESTGLQRRSWEDTYADMARAREDWSDLEATIADGLDPVSRQG